MEQRNPDRSDLLIDLSGIESVPFPQQLITAEMDDTFGLFGPTKLRTHSAPTSTGSDTTSQQAPDIFSPVMGQPSKYSQEDDSVFTNSPMLTGTPMSSKNDRMLRSGTFDAETVSSEMSMLGLNEAFVRSSTSSFVASTTSSESRSSNINGISSIRYDRVTSIESSTSGGGGISAVTAEDYRLADLDDTSESIMPLMKRTPQVDSDPCNIISQVLDRRKSVGKRSVDDDIARKIQEMFDAASPTKNPDFYSRSFRHSLTPARKAPTHEPFSYATPSRVPASGFYGSNSSVGSNITPIPIAGDQNPYVMATAYPDKVQKHQMDITNCSFKVSDHSASSILKNLNSDISERLPTPKRLSFSTSTSSEPDFDTAPPVKLGSDSKNFAKPVGYSLPRLRQPNAIVKSGQQPFKAVHHAVPKVIEPVNAKLTKHYGTVSAPVRRKFAPPMAASSPITSPAKNKNKVLKSSGYGRPSPTYKTAQASSASGAGHGIFKLHASDRGIKPSTVPLGPPPAPSRRNSTGPALQRKSYTSRIQPPEIQTQPASTISRRSLMKENASDGRRY